MENLVDTKEKTSRPTINDLTINIDLPIVRITTVNGDSKQCLQQLLNQAKREVIILCQNWNDTIFQPEYNEILNHFLGGQVTLKILICNDLHGPSPVLISKHLKYGNDAKVKAYLVNTAVCTSLFHWDESILPQYPIIGDDHMYHLRSYEVKDSKKVWFSGTSFNDMKAVKSIHSRFKALMDLPTTVRY